MVCDVYRKKGASNGIVRDYVLPDYTHIKRGHVRTPGEAGTGNEQVTSRIQSFRCNDFSDNHIRVTYFVLFHFYILSACDICHCEPVFMLAVVNLAIMNSVLDLFLDV